MRPVPTVFLRLAFSLHSTDGCQYGFPALLCQRLVHFLILAAGKPQEEQVLFWMCHDRRPHLLFHQSNEFFFGGL